MVNDNSFNSPQSRSFRVALLLCLFLGTLGIHQFYLGRKYLGLAMLMLTVLGILSFMHFSHSLGVLMLLASIVWNILDFVFILFANLSSESS